MSQVPNGYNKVMSVNVGDIVLDYELWAWVEDYSIFSEDLSQVVIASGDRGNTLMLMEGHFDWDGVRDDLDDANFRVDLYRGTEVWLDPLGVLAIGLLENRNQVILSEPGDDGVRDVIRAVNTGTGYLLEESTDLKKVLDKLGKGKQVIVEEGCAGVDSRRCQAVGYRTELAKDEFTVLLDWIFLFRSESSANLEIREVENYFEGAMPNAARLAYVTQDGEFVLVQASMDKEDFLLPSRATQIKVRPTPTPIPIPTATLEPEPTPTRTVDSSPTLEPIDMPRPNGIGSPDVNPGPLNLPAGLIGWWPGEGNANDMVDSNHGILNNGAGFATGKIGQAFSFDGFDDYISIPAPPNSANGPIASIAAWVKPMSKAEENLNIFGQGENRLMVGPGYVGFKANSLATTSTSIPTGEFSHIAATWDGSTVKVYINGGLRAEVPSGRPNLNLECPYEIAAVACLHKLFFHGLIDEVMLFNRAISAAEVRSLYDSSAVAHVIPQSGSQSFDLSSGLVAWWRGEGDAKDSVGNNHGDLRGGTNFAAGKMGQAFSLDGDWDLITVPDSPDLNIRGDVTVALWAKRTLSSGNWTNMIFKGAGEINGVDVPLAYRLSFDPSNKLAADLELDGGGDVDFRGPAINDSQWHHYAYIRSGQSHKLLIDGTVANSGSFSGTAGDTSGLPLVMGAQRHDSNSGDYVQFFAGFLDEVKLYNRALSDAEIRAMYSQLN